MSENITKFDALMSIKPIYAELILNGTKKYEFRKHGFSKPVNKVFIYSTKPICRIVGYFTIDRILKDIPANVWYKCSESAGISERDFYDYFGDMQVAYAIKVNEIHKLENPISPFDLIPRFIAPRSFTYIDHTTFK